MLHAQWTQWAAWLMVGLALLMLVVHDWRGLIAALAALEAALVAVLVLAWPLPLATTQLVAGWLAGAMLAIAQNLRGANPPSSPVLPLSARLVRLLSGGLALALVFTIAPALNQLWPGLPATVRLSGTAVALLGILHAAWSQEPLRLTVGLLTALGGFLVVYAWQQQGLVLTGLLAMFHVLLAWVGSYLLHQTAAPKGAS